MKATNVFHTFCFPLHQNPAIIIQKKKGNTQVFLTISDVLADVCVFVCFRTESVAEKMLTNWFAFLLHKFLKVTCFFGFL